MNHLLEVCDLSVSFHLLEGVILRWQVDLTLDEERSGIVGESACGKSVTAKSIMRIIPTPPGRINSGRSFLRTRSYGAAGGWDAGGPGGKISMIFQEPMTSLNPAFTVGTRSPRFFASTVGPRRRGVGKGRGGAAPGEIPDPEKRARSYPHELSGGMRQRAMIAIALACRPGF